MSGYRAQRDTFFHAALRQIGKEFFPYEQGRLLSGLFIHGDPIQVTEIPKAYEHAVRYRDFFPYTLKNQERLPPYLRCLEGKTIAVDGIKAGVMYYAPQNNAQIIFPMSISLPIFRDLTLHHAGDRLNQGMLDVHVNPDGLVLLALDKQRNLTGKLFRLEHGLLVMGPKKEDVNLSEAFVKPSYESIVTDSSIPFEKYLEMGK